jgi:hypothetical protein
MDSLDDKLITGGSDSKLIEWRDVTQEVEDEEYKEKAEKSKEEHLLSNMIYEGKYKDAAIQAFKLKKNRDLFSIIEMILDQTKKSRNPFETPAKDPVTAVLDNETHFDSQFNGAEIDKHPKTSLAVAEHTVKEIVKEMLKLDSMRLLEIIRDLNVHQKYCRIAQILLFQIFKIFGLSKFIDFVEAQFKSQNEELVKTDLSNAQTMSRKALIAKIQNYLSIISFYSQKHMERVQRNQKLSYLVNFVVSKYTIEQEKLELREQFESKHPIIKKRDLKKIAKDQDSSE